MFIDPEQVEVNDKVVILPKSVVVLEGFIQESGTAGKVDEKTGVPLEISKELLIIFLIQKNDGYSESLV